MNFAQMPLKRFDRLFKNINFLHKKWLLVAFRDLIRRGKLILESRSWLDVGRGEGW